MCVCLYNRIIVEYIELVWRNSVGAKAKNVSIDELNSGRGRIIIFSHEIVDRNEE